MKRCLRRLAAMAFGLAIVPVLAGAAWAQADDCKNRGQLDTLYCDENGDLVADAPKDPKKWRDPSALVFAYTPVEDPAVYQNVFKPFTDYLAQCTGKRVVYYPVQSNSAEIEAMRSGRLHMAGFSTGPTGFAVNMAGAVPFAAKGTEKGPQGYHLISLVEGQPVPEALRPQGQARRPHRAVVEFRQPCARSCSIRPKASSRTRTTSRCGRAATTSRRSACSPATTTWRGVASDVYERMVMRGTLKADDFRIIYTSPLFPTSSFAYAHDLKPDLAKKIVECFLASAFRRRW